MSCCHPFKAFDTGCLTDNGKTDYIICPSTAGNLLDVSFAEKRGKRVSPSAPLVYINGHTYLTDPVAIPCGSCVGCRMDKAKQWKIRICHEMALYPREDVHFITLTYRDKCLPFTKYGQPCLSKKDLQGFLMNMRHPSYGVYRKFRYFACGEYGTSETGTHRPHYHLILFGHLDDLVPYEFKHYKSRTVEDAWKFGIHDIEPVYPESVAYVAGYVEKKQVDPFFDSYPVKPFLMMSTKPAIGLYYVSRLNGFPDRKVYGNFGKLHHASIPRAYLKKCENEPWYPEFKERSKDIAADSLRTNLAAANTDQEEKLGDLQEQAALNRLDKLRKVQL